MKGAGAPLHEVRTIKDLRDMLGQSVELYGEKNAFLVKRAGNPNYKGVTYKEFYQDNQALGTALLDLGLAGKKVALIGENRYEWATTYLSVVNGVGVIVPLDKELPLEEIKNLLQESEANAIIYSGKYEKSFLGLKDEISSLSIFINMDKSETDENSYSFYKLIEKGNALLQAGSEAYRNQEINPAEMKILLFTSGTTGTAKGVMLSHKNISTNLMAMCQMLYIDEKDTFLSLLPLHHTYECTCGYLCQIFRGCTIAYCEGLKYIVQNLQESKATVMLGVPLIFESMFRKVWKKAEKSGSADKLRKAIKVNNFLKGIGIDLSKKLFAQIHQALGGNVRLFISGAAAIDPQVSKGFRDFGMLLVQGYGLTECAPIVALNRTIYYKDDAAGLPLPCMDIKIDNPNEEGIGEIICRGDNVMLGYYRNDTATSKVIKDGWFYTGDLGFIDAEGFVHISGREKNVIVTKNGKNIYPEEVETYLGRSEYIAECMAWGKENEKTGETEVHAQIMPDYEAIADELGEDYTFQQVRELLKIAVRDANRQMSAYKKVVDFTIREEEFAKTTTRKIKRHLVEQEVGKSTEV